MEKLQTALEQARKTRTRQRPVAPVGSSAPINRAPAAGPVDRAWEGLQVAMPEPAALIKHRIVTQVSNPDAVHFDILRTKILLQMRKEGWTRVAITSPTQGCGKTTTAANLAAALGRQADFRTILFDFDLRRPTLHNIFDLRPEFGITELLRGETTFAQSAVRFGDNVALALARGPTSDPSRYMLSDQTITILDEIEDQFQPDMMLFDLPPLLVSDDARAFLKNVDAAILIARAEDSTGAQIKLCQQEIAEHTNPMGVILNQCKFVSASETYDYY